MSRFIRVGLCCVWLLACGVVTGAQRPPTADPCGNPEIESSFWSVVSARVVRVEAGDTLTVSIKGSDVRRVRLIGIDAPSRAEPFGEASRRLLEGLVAGRVVDVWVQFGPERRLPAELSGVVHLPRLDMLDVNLLMLQSGLARHQRAAPYTMSNHAECHYRRAEADARDARRGLWRGGA